MPLFRPNIEGRTTPPIIYWPMDEASGATTIADAIGDNDLTVRDVTPGVDTGDGEVCVQFLRDGSGNGLFSASDNGINDALNNAQVLTVEMRVNASTLTATQTLLQFPNYNKGDALKIDLANDVLTVRVNPRPSTLSDEIATFAVIPLDQWVWLRIVIDMEGDGSTEGYIYAYANGVQLGSTYTASSWGGQFWDGDFVPTTIASRIGWYLSSNSYAGKLHHVIISDYEVTSDPIQVGVSERLGLLLTTDLTAPAARLALRLLGVTTAASASIGLRLEAPDATHYQASAATWSAQVLVGAVDVSARLTGEVSIEAEEDASTIAQIEWVAETGAINPAAFENQKVVIRFEGRDGSGALLYSVTRFTGTSTTARYDPDSGIVTLEATTDLQGRLEALDKPSIDSIVGGTWSPFVFDESVDGYQYARDRLSTIPEEVHVDRNGNLKRVAWAAKATADKTYTDGERFGGTLNLTRAQRRDLVNFVRLTMQFRYTRLRHRQIRVRFLPEFPFCDHLLNGWNRCAKSMVQSAADGTEWTRTSEITFVEFPPTGAYCVPTIGWNADGAANDCHGASWYAARRWAQTITETHTLDVVATDSIETNGTLPLLEDYGVEATFDSTDYEAVKEFSGEPTGSVYVDETADYELDADQAVTDGRSAFETAQAVALAKARTLMLSRARTNRLSFSPVFDPTLDLEHTVSVSTPYLTAKGKVRQITERWGIDNGALTQTVELALSRHDGSGLAADDTLDPPAAPSKPEEEPTSRIYTVGYHMGGTAQSGPDNENWDGYVTNVSPLVQAPGANIYQRRFVLNMPEIEATARDAAEVVASETYEVAIPQDTLTMSA